MSFPDLPRELLFEIAYQLDDARMNALCRTNRQIYDYLNRYLYRRDLTRLVCRSLSWARKNCQGVEVQATVQQAIAAGRHLDHIPAKQYGSICDDAAFYGHTGIVELLLNEGINCNLDYALETAVYHGYAAIVELLLAVPNFDPNVYINIREIITFHYFFELSHILVYSAREGNDAIVKLLLDHPDIDPNCESGDVDRTSALMVAKGPAVVKLLLDRENIDVNKQDAWGQTALKYHIENDFSGEEAKLLLDRDDVDVNLPDMQGQTPLFFACGSADISTIDLLLKKEGINPNARREGGCAPLRRLCRLRVPYRYHGDVVKTRTYLDDKANKVRLLLSHPDTDPNPVDKNGVSLLSYVILNVTPLYGGQLELLLRAAGAMQWCIQY
ncbi:Ankyrin repeat-containing domain protein [Elaphomyces granulatus]